MKYVSYGFPIKEASYLKLIITKDKLLENYSPKNSTSIIHIEGIYSIQKSHSSVDLSLQKHKKKQLHRKPRFVQEGTPPQGPQKKGEKKEAVLTKPRYQGMLPCQCRSSSLHGRNCNILAEKHKRMTPENIAPMRKAAYWFIYTGRYNTTP